MTIADAFPIPILNTNQVTNPEKIGFKLKDDFKILNILKRIIFFIIIVLLKQNKKLTTKNHN